MRRLYFASRKSKLLSSCDLFIASAGYVSTSMWDKQHRPRRQVGTLRRVIAICVHSSDSFTLVEVETTPEWEERRQPLDIEWLATDNDGTWKPPRSQRRLAVEVWSRVRTLFSWTTKPL
jgi:hypothetical protein